MLEDLKISDLLKLSELFNKVKEIKKEYSGYKIVRTDTAGVFAGYIDSRNGQEVVMRDARRLWRWSGAASLSQLAMEGTKDASNCKFPCAVNKVELLNVIEILDCTPKAEKSIREVPLWEN